MTKEIVMKSSESSIAIIGFGSQAKAWAKNLKDSQKDVKIVLAKTSSSRTLAKDLGFEIIDLESDALKHLSLLVLLIPDDQHLNFINANKDFLKPGAHLVYAHGFSLSKEKLTDKYPQFTHSLLAPKAIASEVRFQYETKGKIGAAIYAPNEAAQKELKNLAQAVGFTALYPSHFDEETLADLFSEQSLLCSILPYVSLKSYNLLRKNGVSSEVAFMECFLELKSISTALVRLGPEAFFKLISPNALIGSQKGRQVLLGENFDKGLESLLNDNKSKKFYKEVEVDANQLRQQVLKEWEGEELTHVFKKLKDDLIN
jgi:ketol-acid reductoisomerase